MRGWIAVPIVLVAALVILLPLVALTETEAEIGIKEALGMNPRGECEPVTNLASPWREEPGLAYDRDEPRATTIAGQVYLVGGSRGAREISNERVVLISSDDLTRFEPRSGRYEDLAPLPHPVNHAGVTSYRGSLYVLGGYGAHVDRRTYSTFYRYDPDSDRWTRLPDLPQPRAAMAVGVIGHTLIAAGGARNSKRRSDVYGFDFRERRWSRLPNMHSGRGHVGAAVAGGKLYVLGGRTENSLAVATAERYDPAKRRWENLPPLPEPVGGLAAVTVHGEPIAIGGGDDGAGTVSGVVQELEPQDGGWRLLPSLRTPRHGHAAAVAGGRIWVFGGSACAYFAATDRVESLPASDAE